MLFALLFYTGSSQCCCTAVHSRKRGVWKTCAKYVEGQIKLVGGPAAGQPKPQKQYSQIFAGAGQRLY